MHHSRRDLVNACSYVPRTDFEWRLLPETEACDQLLKRDLGTKQDLAATRNMIARNSTITDEKQVCFLSLRLEEEEANYQASRAERASHAQLQPLGFQSDLSSLLVHQR